MINLERYPIVDRNIARQSLVDECRRQFGIRGMFSLPKFLLQNALYDCVREVTPLFESEAFTHSRVHNIYFDEEFSDLVPDHPAMRLMKTTNHTICGDQIPLNPITQLYTWQPFIEFLADATSKSHLYPMAESIGKTKRDGILRRRIIKLAF